MEAAGESLDFSSLMDAIDPTLGPLWVDDALDIEHLNLEGASLHHNSGEDQQELLALHSPFYGLDQHLEFQYDSSNSPSLENIFPDWGELDDLIHQAQVAGDQIPIHRSSVVNSENVEHFLERSNAEAQNAAQSFNSTFGHEEDPSSSIPTYFNAFTSWNDFTPSSNIDGAIPSPARSNAESNATVQSERDRRHLTQKRRPNLQQGDNSPFHEFILESNQLRSRSRASASSRHQVPLGEEARQNMRAVKAVGACWRCKVFRKPCKPETPCEPCRTTYNPLWQKVGCKRGALKDEDMPIILCPKSNLREKGAGVTPAGGEQTQKVNMPPFLPLGPTIGNRTKDFPISAWSSSSWDADLTAMLSELNVEQSTISELRVSTDIPPKDRHVVVPILKPLEKSVLVIVWELFQYPSALDILSSWTKLHKGSIGSFVKLLRCAVIYEADLDNESAKGGLISKSIICLRSCLVALREMNAGYLGNNIHQSCTQSTCKIDCIRNLQFDMDHYLNELSNIIIKKENIHNRKWWLTAFYSFCVQSFVRKALITLVNPIQVSVPSKGPQDYHHTAIRLFTAISGTCDPLSDQAVTDLLKHLDESEKFLVEHYQIAQLCVNQPEWTHMGGLGSGGFLSQLFEDLDSLKVESDNGTVEDGRQNTTELTILPEPYLPDSSGIDAYRKFRSDWDIARCNYTKQLVGIGKFHGWESQVFHATEEKWAFTDALWKKNNAIAITEIFEDRKASARGQSIKPIDMKRAPRLDSLFTKPSQLGRARPPDIYASTRRPPSKPNTRNLGTNEEIYKEEARFEDDLYWPRWLRGPYDSIQEGWCGMCQPGRWLSLDGPYQDDKDFNHGVSGCTGKTYPEPKEVRCMEDGGLVWWGLCGTCDEWIEILGEREEGKAWFVHAFGCFV